MMSEEMNLDILEDKAKEGMESIEETVVERKNPFCVISKQTFGEYAVHDIQTNSAWAGNPYGDYAVVPDEMVEEIMATRGFCDIELNEDGTEVASSTAREIPKIPEPEAEPTEDELQWQAITELEIEQMETAQAITDLEIAQLEGSVA